MAGTGWDSADLLTRFNQKAGRPTVDAMTDAQKYVLLADAEQYVFTQIASIAPRVLYGPPTQMVTSDGGYTFTFGTDGNGYALFPMGKTRIFAELTAVPNYPWIPGRDYLDEGIRIRIPNNMQWSGPLYWYGLTPIAQLSASQQPVLQPPSARILIVIEAVRSLGESYDRNPGLVLAMEKAWARQFGPWMTQLRRHFRGGGALGPLCSSATGLPSGFGGPAWGGTAFW